MGLTNRNILLENVLFMDPIQCRLVQLSEGLQRYRSDAETVEYVPRSGIRRMGVY